MQNTGFVSNDTKSSYCIAAGILSQRRTRRAIWKEAVFPRSKCLRKRKWSGPHAWSQSELRLSRAWGLGTWTPLLVLSKAEQQYRCLVCYTLGQSQKLLKHIEALDLPNNPLDELIDSLGGYVSRLQHLCGTAVRFDHLCTKTDLNQAMISSAPPHSGAPYTV